ncbi:MAG: hypothetical protein QM535_04385 [Limnohabitans sp.]|nr:hypothetical protein [Limnohabitans sp.]
MNLINYQFSSEIEKYVSKTAIVLANGLNTFTYSVKDGSAIFFDEYKNYYICVDGDFSLIDEDRTIEVFIKVGDRAIVNNDITIVRVQTAEEVEEMAKPFFMPYALQNETPIFFMQYYSTTLN